MRALVEEKYFPRLRSTWTRHLFHLPDEDDIGAISHASGLPALATTSISPVAIDQDRQDSWKVDASDSRGRIALYDAADSKGRIALNDS